MVEPVASEEQTMLNKIYYFNNAGHCRLSPKVQQVGKEWLEKDPWDLHAEDDQKRVRQLFSQLIQAQETDIAITPCTSYAITMAAHNFERNCKEGKILLLQDQFSSAVYPWEEVCDRSDGRLSFSIIPYPNTDNGESWTELIVERLSTESDIKCVCLPPLHWSDGATIDLKAIGELCRARDIMLIVDATQALGIFPVSVKEIRPTMLCSSVHKWLRSPSGQSLVYIDPEFVESWTPLDQHGRSRDIPGAPDWDVAKNVMTPKGYPEAFVKDARKFDAGGRPSPSILPMLRAALEEVVEIDQVEAQQRLRLLVDPLLQWASSRSDLETIPSNQAYHIVGLRPRDVTTEKLLTIAKSLKDQGIMIAVRSGALRISPYLDNVPDEIQYLIDALDDVL